MSLVCVYTSLLLLLFDTHHKEYESLKSNLKTCKYCLTSFFYEKQVSETEKKIVQCFVYQVTGVFLLYYKRHLLSEIVFFYFIFFYCLQFLCMGLNRQIACETLTEFVCKKFIM